MKPCYASLALGILFFTASFLIPADAIDINAFDTYLEISHSLILLLVSLFLCGISLMLYRKYRHEKY